MTNGISFDSRDFRRALGSFTTGVTVVTTRGQHGTDVGLTANSFNSVSLEPPLVLWSLGKTALSMKDFAAAEYFAVHILAEDQQELSNRFAQRGADKFANLSLVRGPGDIPLLAHCNARFVCRTASQYEGGDHVIFMGEVVDFENFDQRPLLFHNGQYAQILRPGEAGDANDITAFGDASFGFLLRYCSAILLDKLKAELARHKLTVAQYYFLALAARSGTTHIDTLLKESAKGDSPPVWREIDGLVEQGYLRFDDDDVHLTEAGSKLHLELLAFYKASETAALSALDYDTRQTLQIALTRIAMSLRAQSGAGQS